MIRFDLTSNQEWGYIKNTRYVSPSVGDSEKVKERVMRESPYKYIAWASRAWWRRESHRLGLLSRAASITLASEPEVLRGWRWSAPAGVEGNCEAGLFPSVCHIKVNESRRPRWVANQMLTENHLFQDVVKEAYLIFLDLSLLSMCVGQFVLSQQNQRLETHSHNSSSVCADSSSDPWVISILITLEVKF